jgi:predicted nucleic acid-binding protein
MPGRIFVDTSFVIALTNDKDQYHDQVQALSYKFENSPLITTDAVLLEIGNALAKDFRSVNAIKQYLYICLWSTILIHLKVERPPDST